MLTVDVSKTVAELTDKLGHLAYAQMPFAASQALNETAEFVRRKQSATMRGVFDRPTQYITEGFFVKRSTKQTLQAEVGLKDKSSGVPVSKYMAAHIGGGQRKPKRFEAALTAIGILPPGERAVPGAGAKIDANGNMSAAQMVQILSYFKAFPDNGKGRRQNMTDRKRAKLLRGSKRAGGFEYFVARLQSGKPIGIWERVSFGSGAGHRPVLVFVRSATYRAVYDFEGVASEAVQSEFGRQFERALADAMRTAK